MANIKNFGLVGVGSDVQFGKSGPRLINETGIFKFKNAAGDAFADATFANLTADTLKGQEGKMVTVDATGKLILGGLADALATDAEVEAIRVILAQATADEADRAAGVEEAIQGELDATQAGAGLTEAGLYVAETAFNAETAPAGAHYISGATSLKAADLILDAAIKAANVRIDGLGTGAIADLQAELDLTQAAIGVDADGNFITLTGSNYINAATSAMSAVTLLDAAVKVRADAIAQEALDRANADASIRADMQAAIAGITWENPVKQIVADIAARDALVDLIVGDRIYVTEDNKVYTKTAEGFDAGELMVQGAAFFDKATTVPYVFNGTDMVQFNGAAGLTAGRGLFMVGNTMDLDLSSTGGLTFSPDDNDPSNKVAIKLADVSLEVDAAGLKLSTLLQTEIAALRSELDLEVGTDRDAAITAAIDLLTTDAIEEGTLNLYFTAERARASLSVVAAAENVAGLVYDAETGVLGLNPFVASKADVATALQEAKDYADQVATSAANAVKYVAKSVYQEFTFANAGTPVTIAADVKGRVHRVKVMIDSAFVGSNGSTAAIQVGVDGTNGQLMTTASVDASGAGVYVVEINQLYAADTAVKVFVDGTELTAGAGAVIVEYFTA
jgi:hypothetical protein